MRLTALTCPLYSDLAVTQLFYTSNMYHDLLHRLGFDEVSGNFQMDNFGRGGLGGDAVICQAQDGSGTDNASESGLFVNDLIAELIRW
jgi:extracellular elastinolytic metalloproteinase